MPPPQNPFTLYGFTIRGKRHLVSYAQVEAAMQDVEPERVSKLSVMINEIEYPINQVVSTVLKIDRLDVQSTVAYHLLTTLGFTVLRRE